MLSTMLCRLKCCYGILVVLAALRVGWGEAVTLDDSQGQTIINLDMLRNNKDLDNAVRAVSMAKNLESIWGVCPSCA